MRAFAQADRFVSEVRRESCARRMCSSATKSSSANAAARRFSNTWCPADLRDFSLFDFDLAETDLPRFSIARRRHR